MVVSTGDFDECGRWRENICDLGDCGIGDHSAVLAVHIQNRDIQRSRTIEDEVEVEDQSANSVEFTRPCAVYPAQRILGHRTEQLVRQPRLR